jgi:hypothetical protein
MPRKQGIPQPAHMALDIHQEGPDHLIMPHGFCTLADLIYPSEKSR